MKLKNGIDPVGTSQLIRIQRTAAKYTWHLYKVIEVTGVAQHGPNTESPVIWMELAEKTPGNLPQFVSLPLSAFPNRVTHHSDSDKFWEETKSVMV